MSSDPLDTKALAKVERAPQPLLEKLGLTAEQLAATDVGKLERLLDFQLRVDAEAVTARVRRGSFSRVQARMTPVVQGRIQQGQQELRWAKVEQLCAMLDPLLIAEGIAWSFSDHESPVPNHVRITMQLRHGTHVEPYHYDMPIWDGKGARGGGVMTGPQASGTMHTYACRYLRLGVFGVQQFDTDDNDGQATGTMKLITPDQVADLAAKIEEEDAPLAAVLASQGVERLEDLTAGGRKGVLYTLEQRKRLRGSR